MKIILDAAVLEDASVSNLELGEIFGMVACGRHRIEVDTTALERWISTQSARIADEVRAAIARSDRKALGEPKGVATVHVMVDVEPLWEFPTARLGFSEALRLLREPLGLLLENDEHDGWFLRGILPPPVRDWLKDHLTQRWAAEVHGGGGEIEAKMERRARDTVQSLRTWVMFDSDRLHPDETRHDWDGRAPNGHGGVCPAVSWERTAQRLYRARYWRLVRRSVENYLPVAELEIWAAGQGEQPATNPRAGVAAFARMTRDQRWHFSMKDGFAKDEVEPARSRVRDLYSNIPPEDRAVLHKGIGRKLRDHYEHATRRAFAWDDDAGAEADAAALTLAVLLY